MQGATRWKRSLPTDRARESTDPLSSKMGDPAPCVSQAPHRATSRKRGAAQFWGQPPGEQLREPSHRRESPNRMKPEQARSGGHTWLNPARLHDRSRRHWASGLPPAVGYLPREGRSRDARRAVYDRDAAPRCQFRLRAGDGRHSGGVSPDICVGARSRRADVVFLGSLERCQPRHARVGPALALREFLLSGVSDDALVGAEMHLIRRSDSRRTVRRFRGSHNESHRARRVTR